MINTTPNVEPTGRYELKAAAEALGVDRSTILRYTNQGLLKCTIKRSNHRRCWTGAELIRFWKASF